MFVAIIHDDENIPKVQKLRYLRSYVKGNAARVIENLQTTDANYEIAWNLLEERYDNRRVIIQNHMHALIDLSTVTKESASSLRSLLDTILRHVRALEVLGEPTGSWDTPLVCLVTAKLDKESRREWERSIKSKTMPKYEELTKFLNERCQILETLNPGSSDQNKQNLRSDNKSQANVDRRNSGKSFLNTQLNLNCYNCKGNHFIQNCEEFLKLSVSERSQVIKKKGLCFNCFKRNHLISECKSRNCTICNRRHHTLLHIEFVSETKSDQNKANDSNQVIKNMHIADSSQVALSTAVIDIFDKDGNSHACRAFLDSGSQPNLMTEELANRLKLKRNKLQSTIEVVNNQEINSAEWVVATLKSRTSPFSTKLTFLVLPHITGNIPATPIKRNYLDIPRHVKLADPDFDKPSKIDALIGAEIFYDLLDMHKRDNKIPLALPHTSLLSTKVGWIITGKPSSDLCRNKFSCNLIRDPLSVQMENFWKLEELSEKRFLSAEEEACEEHFRVNVQRDGTCRYMVRLPFNEKQDAIGSSYDLARRRFFSLERRLERDSSIKNQYHQFMKTYSDLNHMEPVPSSPRDGYYIPHHAVMKESSLTTKLRVVFDGSSGPGSGVSLNESLMVGPTIQDGIFELVLRFRLHSFVLSADIEKMYRQFLIHPKDRKFQKILWRFNCGDPLQTYQLNTVTYGTASAPFLATRCLHQLAEDEGTPFPKAATALRNDFYVDDLLTGTNTFEEAKQLRDELIQITSKAGLKLCKWISNESKLIEDLSDRADNLRQKLCEDQSTKMLGISWNALEDTLNFDVNIGPEPDVMTKRNVLSQVAQLFDPLGLISPVISFAKIEMKKLWKAELGWDDQIPTELSKTWQVYREQLDTLNGWTIPRRVKINSAKDLQLHGFADASQQAYGACIYLRSSNENGYHSRLLCSKSRVAPAKTVSVPRLELCAALLLVRLYKAVEKSLKVKFDKTIFWSDSTIVLNWINTPPYKLQTFEANRIAEIQGATESGNWKHVGTKENPADSISRGQLPSEFLNNQLWKHGPAWLSCSELNWPTQQLKINEDDEKESSEERGIPVLTNVMIKKWNLWDRYSSWTQLVRTVAYCLRFGQIVRKQTQIKDFLTVAEIQFASKRIIQLVQHEEFPEETHQLSAEKEGSEKKQVSKNSKILRLNPIMKENLLRVGGRIKNSDLTDKKKNPILLPKTHPVTDLIIRKTHLDLMHAGINATLYATRDIYWIVDGRCVVRKIIHACVKCCRAKPKEVSYVMGSLPKVRVTESRPFENVGIDYCGYFHIREKRLRNRNKVKVYAALFVCLTTKAIHIELVSDLTTDSFLGCLRRFFARRGKSRALYSDNATNFVGANNELRALHASLNSEKHNEEVSRFLANQEIEWHFIPARTPHFGGIWEAGVKSLKHHMRRTIGDTLFTFEELSTYMCEIEAILNSRPLTPLSSDPNDLQVLTPGHFLIGQSLTTIPSIDYSRTPSNRLSVWQHMQKLKLDLWKRWSNEYLTELNVRSKWHMGQVDDVKIGTIVTLRDNNLPPLKWALGRIVEVIRGDDKIIRVVKVQTQNGIVERGIKKIAPLPA